MVPRQLTVLVGIMVLAVGVKKTGYMEESNKTNVQSKPWTIIKWNGDKDISPAEFELYYKYKQELWEIDNMHPYSKQAVHEWYAEITGDAGYIVRIFNGNEQIGFIFIGTEPNCHEDADFYVQDCYILPEFRRRSIMSETVSEFLSEHPGVYSMFLIDQNVPAVNFWNKMFKSLDYVEISIHDYNDMETETCHLHGFMKKKAR